MVANVITPKDINALSGQERTEPWPLGAWLVALFRKAQNWLEYQRRYRRTVLELSRLSDALLADIGLERNQIEEVARRLAAAASRQ